MKKNGLFFAAAMIAAMSIMAYAGSWQSDANGWWYQNDDGSWPADQWVWIDGNQDGIAECYRFDGSGYCLINTTTPDGYTVDGNGAWTQNGQVQTRAAQTSADSSADQVNLSDTFRVYGSKQVIFAYDAVDKGDYYEMNATIYKKFPEGDENVDHFDAVIRVRKNTVVNWGHPDVNNGKWIRSDVTLDEYAWESGRSKIFTRARMNDISYDDQGYIYRFSDAAVS
jgi:hypothetical protein